MTDETALQVVEFLKSRFRENHRKIIVDFYGGEPLLSTDRIIFIEERLKPFVEERGGEFEFTLVTNGSLLKKTTVDKLKQYGLAGARVTIDGPPDIHNFYRPFKNGAESFDCIIKNIKEAGTIISIAIGGNFTQENYKRFPVLLDILIQEGITPDKVRQIKFTQALQTNDQFAMSEFQEGCSCPSDSWVAATLYLREEILKRGYKTPKPGPAACMIELSDSLAIHYDGSIYKCAGFIGHKEYAIGEVWNGTFDYRDIYALDSWRKEAECRECRYLPLCFGGCRYAKYQSDGSMAKVNCMKDFLDKAADIAGWRPFLYALSRSLWPEEGYQLGHWEQTLRRRTDARIPRPSPIKQSNIVLISVYAPFQIPGAATLRAIPTPRDYSARVRCFTSPENDQGSSTAKTSTAGEQ